MRIANLVLTVFWVTLCHLAQASDLPIEEIRLPPGFKIELLARVDNAREMALGAKGTLIGRAFLYGLGAMGEAGVTRCLEIIRNELDLTMAFCGRTRIAQVDKSVLLPGSHPG